MGSLFTTARRLVDQCVRRRWQRRPPPLVGSLQEQPFSLSVATKLCPKLNSSITAEVTARLKLCAYVHKCMYVYMYIMYIHIFVNIP